MEKDWLYSTADKFSRNHPEGPLPEIALKRLLISKQISYDTLVWSEGMSEWVPASSVECLKAPPPLPAPEPAAQAEIIPEKESAQPEQPSLASGCKKLAGSIIGSFFICLIVAIFGLAIPIVGPAISGCGFIPAWIFIAIAIYTNWGKK